MDWVSTTDFFTLCWKRARPSLLALLCCLGLAVGWSPAAMAQPAAAELTDFHLERQEGALYLSATVRLDLPAPVEDALVKGIPVHFVVDAELLRDRWYWYDRRVAAVARHMRLAYQPLTRRWRLNTSSEPIDAAGLGVSFTQYFDTLAEALLALRRISRWKIAEAADMEPGARHNVDFHFRLDVTQLPRPFQILGVGPSEWVIAVSRNQRLPVEGGR